MKTIGKPYSSSEDSDDNDDEKSDNSDSIFEENILTHIGIQGIAGIVKKNREKSTGKTLSRNATTKKFISRTAATSEYTRKLPSMRNNKHQPMSGISTMKP